MRIRNLFAALILTLALQTVHAQRTPMNYRGAYAGGTTYQKGDSAASAGAVYVSIANNNTGNAPLSNPSDWTPLGGLVSFNARTGVVVLSAADVNGVGAITNPITLTAAEVNAVGPITNSTSGTAAALGATPTLCSTGQAPTGVDASGNVVGCAATGGGVPVIGDKTSSSTYGTVYQNTTAHPLKFFLTDSTGAGPAAGTVTIMYGAANPPTSTGPSCSDVAVSSGSVSCFDYFEIPPSDYYKVASSGTALVSSWIEITTP